MGRSCRRPIFPRPRNPGYTRGMSEYGFDIWSAVVGAAFAAFCIWLGVRIFNRRERWAKKTARWLFIVCVVYPLSFGPMIYITGFLGIIQALIIYQPVFTFAEAYPPFGKLWFDYVAFWGLSC